MFNIEQKTLKKIFLKINSGLTTTQWTEGKTQKLPPTLEELEENAKAVAKWMHNKAKLRFKQIESTLPSVKKRKPLDIKKFEKANEQKNEAYAIARMLEKTSVDKPVWTNTCACFEGLFQRAMTHAAHGFLVKNKAYNHIDNPATLFTLILESKHLKNVQSLDSDATYDLIENTSKMINKTLKRIKADYVIGHLDISRNVDIRTHVHKKQIFPDYWCLHWHFIISQQDAEKFKERWQKLNPESKEKGVIHINVLDNNPRSIAYVFKRHTSNKASLLRQSYTKAETNQRSAAGNTRYKSLRTEERLMLLEFLSKLNIEQKTILNGVRLSSTINGFIFKKEEII